MDGYWAFEMGRRGAASVVALDLEDPDELDWPASLRGHHERSLDETKAQRFALAKAALGSGVERVLLPSSDLGPELGSFDFVFCGDLLLHVKDPITPVENPQRVHGQRGSTRLSSSSSHTPAAGRGAACAAPCTRTSEPRRPQRSEVSARPARRAAVCTPGSATERPARRPQRHVAPTRLSSATARALATPRRRAR